MNSKCCGNTRSLDKTFKYRIAQMYCWEQLHTTIDAIRNLGLRADEWTITNRNGKGENKKSITFLCFDNGNITVKKQVEDSEN